MIGPTDCGWLFFQRIGKNKTFELRKWELREGRIDILLRASVSRFSL
jgi:hypothetical protein